MPDYPEGDDRNVYYRKKVLDVPPYCRLCKQKFKDHHDFVIHLEFAHGITDTDAFIQQMDSFVDLTTQK